MFSKESNKVPNGISQKKVVMEKIPSREFRLWMK